MRWACWFLASPGHNWTRYRPRRDFLRTRFFRSAIRADRPGLDVGRRVNESAKRFPPSLPDATRYGLLLIGLARNVRTHRPVIVYQALALQGTSMLATLAMSDSGMPAWWLYGDLAAVWGFNLAVLALAVAAGKPRVA